MRISLVLCVAVLAFVLVGCGHRAPSVPALRIILQANPMPGDNWPSDQAGRRAVLGEARQAILRRVEQIHGVCDPTVRIDGDDKLVVELPGDVSGAEAIASVTATSRGGLQFYYMRSLQSKRNPIADWSVDSVGSGYVFTGPRKQTIDSMKQPEEVLKQVVGAPKAKPILTGKDLMANAGANINAQNQIVININFSEKGKRVFADFTRDHVSEYLAIFYDGKLLTCPVIREAILDGSAEISGFDSLPDAKRAARALNAGDLPVTLKMIAKP